MNYWRQCFMTTGNKVRQYFTKLVYGDITTKSKKLDGLFCIREPLLFFVFCASHFFVVVNRREWLGVGGELTCLKRTQRTHSQRQPTGWLMDDRSLNARGTTKSTQFFAGSTPLGWQLNVWCRRTNTHSHRSTLDGRAAISFSWAANQPVQARISHTRHKPLKTMVLS